MLGLNKEAIKHFKILKKKKKTKNAQKQNRYRWTTRSTFIEIRTRCAWNTSVKQATFHVNKSL